MRLTRLEARNILSFDQFEMDLNPRRTVIVGPNGSGKTNLTRLLMLMGSALLWAEEEGPRGPAVAAGPAAQILNGYARARHLPDHGGSQAVRIGVELTTEWERALMVAYVRAAVLSTVQEELGQGQQHQDALAEWVMGTVTAATCEELFSGTLIAEHTGIPGWHWEMSFEFTPSATGERYRWILQSQRLHFAAIMTASTAMSPPPGLTTGRGALVNYLLPNLTPGSPLLTSLPQLPPFALAMLCPAAGAAVDLAAGTSNQYLDPSVVPYRDFLRLAGLATPSTSSRRYALSAALWPIWRNGLILVGEQLRGVGTWGTALRPAGQYTWGELVTPSLGREPHLLPLRLFRLKNGSAEERSRYQRAQDTFSKLAPGRACDVAFAAAGSGSGEPPSGADPDGSGLDIPEAGIDVLVTKAEADASRERAEAKVELPIQLHGAGTWEALVLAEALCDAAGRVVVLDEPATTLHPTWQRGLAAQLDQSDGQLLLITHSAHLVPMQTEAALSELVRFSAATGSTCGHRVGPEIDGKASATLIKEFSQSADARGIAFARGAVLVEGPTELAALPMWFGNSQTSKARGTPWDLDLAIVSVGGSANYRPFLSLLVALDVPWAVVCDGKAFVPGRDQIFNQVADAQGGGKQLLKRVADKIGTASSLDDARYRGLRKIGESVGIFTVATTWRNATEPGLHEDFEGAAESMAPGKRRKGAVEVGFGSKVRIARWIAENTPCPKEIDQLYGKILDALHFDR